MFVNVLAFNAKARSEPFGNTSVLCPVMTHFGLWTEWLVTDWWIGPNISPCLRLHVVSVEKINVQTYFYAPLNFSVRQRSIGVGYSIYRAAKDCCESGCRGRSRNHLPAGCFFECVGRGRPIDSRASLVDITTHPSDTPLATGGRSFKSIIELSEQSPCSLGTDCFFSRLIG